MNDFKIQVRRSEQWRNVTTFTYGHSDRESVLREVRRQREGWSRYDGFAGCPIRIVETVPDSRFGVSQVVLP